MKTNLLITAICLTTMGALAVVQTKSIIAKDARIFVAHYEQSDLGSTYHVRDDYQSGDYSEIDTTGNYTLTWDDGQGGQEVWNGSQTGTSSIDPTQTATTTSTLDIWPATTYPNLVPGTFTDNPPGSTDDEAHPPNIILQELDLKTVQDYTFSASNFWVYLTPPFYCPYVEKGHLTDSPHAKAVIKFYSGGMGLPKQQSVYWATVQAYQHQQNGVSSQYNSPTYAVTPVSPQNITLGDLGPLYADGITYAQIPDNSTKDITPKVSGVSWFTFAMPVLVKYTLTSTVSCPALTDTNLNRTSLGVGETVTLGTLPGETLWSTSAGGLSVPPQQGAATVTLTAPSNQATATVTAQVRNVKLTISFGVVEPSGYDHAVVASRDQFAIGYQGAGMYLQVFMAPTSVSFNQVQFLEVGENASSLTGYFAVNGAPSHIGNGADTWTPVDCNNSWTDHAWSATYRPWVSGGYTWDIPAQWRVGNNGTANSLASGWNQVYSFTGDGTTQITKFGETVTRHQNELYGTASP